MNIKFTTKTEAPTVKPVDVAIDTSLGVMRGTAEPKINTDGSLRWHLCLNGHPSDFSLIQGFGASPSLAIADAIVNQRKKAAAMCDELNALETACGTTNKDLQNLDCHLLGCGIPITAAD